MSLLESIVLLDIVQVIPSEGDSAVHLGGEDDTPNIKELITETETLT